MRIKRFFLSRATVLTLVAIILVAVLIGTLVPQRFGATEPEMFKWKAAHRWFAPWVRRLGFDHVYTAPWFAVLLTLAFVALLLSSMEQFRAARRRTFGPKSVPAGEGVHTGMAEEGLVRALRRRGYLPVVREGPLRFVKHPWGYWGNFLLHLGMVITIAAGLFVALTQQRAELSMYAGKDYPTDYSWNDTLNGLLVGDMVLPYAVRLNRVRASFWPKGELKQLSSDLSFHSGREGEIELSVGVSEKLSFMGITIYQTTRFGDTFTVEFIETSSGKKTVQAFQMLHPRSLGKPTYRDMRLPWMQDLLRAKYYVDTERKDFQSSEPELHLRIQSLGLDDYGEVLGQVALLEGEGGKLGPYTIRFVETMKWCNLVFVNIKGMPFIFLGFFVIVFGASLGYLTPPREVVAVKADGGYALHWKAARFKEFYVDEYDKVLKGLEVTESDE